MAETENLNIVPEEETKRYHELADKEDKSEEETTELNTLKDSYAKTARDRIKELTWKAKEADERYGTESARKQELEQELAELKAAKNEPAEPLVGSAKETIKVGDKEYFTDRALEAKIKTGEIQENEAVRHQQDRLTANAADIAYKRIKAEDQKSKEVNIRIADAEDIYKKYPQFRKINADGTPNRDFAPSDPLYKEAARIFETGYKYNPKGLSQSIAEAKRVLRMTDTRIDNSDNLSVRSSHPADVGPKEKEIEMTEYEIETAISMYTRGDINNPKTGRPYTDKEAIAKAKEAKRKTMAEREARK